MGYSCCFRLKTPPLYLYLTNNTLSFTFSPSSVKLLPLRPPPIKSIPGRPPPPAINSTSSASQNPTPAKVTPAPSLSAASQVTPSQTSSSPPPPSTANQTQAQKAPKRGPPLPPRPKPGHLLYNSYVVNLHTHMHAQRYKHSSDYVSNSTLSLRSRKC